MKYINQFIKYPKSVWKQVLDYKVKKICSAKKNHDSLTKLKDRYRGKRCFIIGNGPSLSIDDLEYIRDEITFASNRIYIMYDKTTWRPTYYFCQDSLVLTSNIDEIKNEVKSIKLIKPVGKKKYFDNDAIYFNINYDDYNKKIPPRFSEDVSKWVYDGYTVTYSMIQFAAYMGFKEIYLLGVDFNYSLDNSYIDKNSYADERMYDKDKVGYPPNIEYNLKAYQIAKEYADKNNIIIKNATRGGKLEVFDRIKLENILDKQYIKYK